MEIIATYGTVFLVLAIVFGFYMTWGIGANDVANAMGTSVGSGAITVMQAIIIAAIFEFAGAFIAGGNVTSTIRKGIVDPSSIAGQPELLVFGMLAAMLYGFDEIMDREALDRELRVWSARWLAPDYAALHHLAWSRYPVRTGFADFQLELRQVSAMATPEDIGDTAALLMCLTTNFAAPGAAPL